MAEIVISIAAKVVELLVVPIGKHICYPFKCQSNIDVLKKQVEKLTGVREMLQHSVDEAKRQGDEIEKVVEKWLNSVDEFTNGVAKPIIDDEDNAKKRCLIGLCPNLMVRYSLSKKALKTTEYVVDLLGDGKFEEVSFRPPQKAAFNNLMETLRNADVNLIGVYGMGGVGKTTLVKRVVAQAIEDKLFDVVAMADVNETANIKQIQGQIADQLGLKFEEESLSGRAARLRDRLKEEKRVLLVLNNIWAKLDLEAVGIPLGELKKRSALQEEARKGRNDGQIRQCKILLIARSGNVLSNDMNVKKNFIVQILSEVEARNLFWKIVGDSAKQSDFDTIGIEIVQFCAGLPVAIATIASALKKKSLFEWKDALYQLRRSNPRNLTGMDAKVYSVIKLSYDFLESEEAKSLFLLCSLYDASYNISLDDLLRYVMGLSLFPDVSTVEQGRNSLHTTINDLKASSLLLDAYTNERVKMHDIIHAVAVSIASTNMLMFNIQTVVGLKEILEEILPKDAVAVSLPDRDICELPERLELPKLKLLKFKNDLNSLPISDTFFEGVKELKVLDLTSFHLSSLPSSLQLLTNLQTLCLHHCVLGDIATIGYLTKLEVLSLLHSDIEHLPREVRQLTRLRLLDMSECQNLKIITPGVVSSLTWLEELYMRNSFVQWDANGQTNASLTELKQLSRLTTLEIHILDAHIMPQDLFSRKLDRYRIFIGDVWDWFGNYETSKTLKLKWSNRIYLGNGIKTLLKKTEDLYLDELKGVKNVLYELDDEGFPQLKHLHVQNGPEIQYIINSVQFGPSTLFPKLESMFLHNLINLEKMCHGQLAADSFIKLRIVKVGKCDRLKHLFSFSMAKNLLKLEEIEVTNCKMLEEIVFKESHEQFQQHNRASKIEFTQLRTLRLQCLPQLTSFGSKEFVPDTGSQEILAEAELGSFISSFSQNVLLPRLEDLKLSSININCMWLDQLPAMSSCCQTLTSLTLELCGGNLKFLFSYSMVKSLVLLEKLEIQNCKSIEGIINIEELRGEGRVIKMVFPKLINLQLKGLPNFTQFASGNSVEIPSLSQLSIQDCPKLKTFSTAVLSADIKQSKTVKEMNCQDDIHPLFDQKVALPTLASLNLSSIYIQTIWHKQLQPMSSCFQKLTKLIVDGCDTLKDIFSSSMVESLIQLEVLEISNCKFMERVIITDGESIRNNLFPKLYQLDLKHLSELTSFCSFAGNSIELPSLAQLWLENCPKMHTFVSNYPHADMPASKEEPMRSEKNLQSQTQPLFDEKVQLPNLKNLWIFKLDNLRKIWHHQPFSDSFSKIDYVVIHDCHNLPNVFPIYMIGRLQKLNVLAVQRCNSLEKIFEEVNISSCTVEEIVAEEEDVVAVPKLVFPQLTSLELANLPSLRSIYPGLHISEWPKLKKLGIWSCNKVEILTSEFLSLRKSYGESQLENSIQEPLFIVDKVGFPTLEKMVIFGMDNLESIWYNQFLGDSFYKLKSVEVNDCQELMTIFPSCICGRLSRLESLTVKGCGLVEEIFDLQGLNLKEKHSIEATTQLKELYVDHLSNLKCIWNKDPKGMLSYGKLQKVTVFLCPNLENLFPTSVAKSLLNLVSLKVSDCGLLEESIAKGGVKHFVPSFGSFQNLTTLEVLKCNGLVNLMVVSVAKSLVQLTRLKITKCKMIEEIITHGQVVEMENRIAFIKLKYLELYRLPRLASFCSGNYIIECPFLQQVVVIRCPNMKIFSQGALRTPRLHKLQIARSEDEEFWEGDLNTTIQKMFKEMVGFRGIENLTLSEFLHLKEVWNNQFPVSLFVNLKSLVVDNDCSSLRYIFIPSVALDLVQLQELKITNCAILETIVDIKEERIDNTMFPNLSRLELKDLPILSRFCNFTGNSIKLPSLTQLWIDNCPNMETFIFDSIDADMPVGKENFHRDVRPLFDEKVGFPSLEKMVISGMDNLESIWHHQFLGDSFSFPKLKSLEVNDCQVLKTIFPTCICGTLSSLESLTVKSCGLVEEIFDLHGLNLKEKHSIEITTQLRELYVDHMSNLKHIWNEDPKGMLSYRKLQKVTVFLCPNLENLFPASVAKSLMILDSLEVSDCGVEEIIAMGGVKEVADRFLLPQLSSLQLHNLPQLRTFYPGHTVEGPCLKRLGLHYCDKVKLFISEFLGFYETIEEGQHDLSPPFFLVQELEGTNQDFPNLEELQLSGKAIAMRWPSQVPGHVFGSLKSLELNDDESTVLPLDFVQRFGNLGKLSMNSSSYKEIFSYGAVKEHPQIKHLVLSGLFDLKQIWKQGSKIDLNFQKLEILEVRSCFNLINLMPSSASFKNLMILEVWGCEGLKNLLTSSTAKSLVLLEKLEVFDCKMLTEVVANEGAITEEINFRKLKSLSLVYLQSLASFCSKNHILNFPILESLVVNECPKMKIFSEGVMSTPKLHKLELNWEAFEQSWEVGVNTTIKHGKEVKPEMRET